MVIEGKKNMSFIRRALLGYLVYSAQQLQKKPADVKVWDAEISEINRWLDAAEHNLGRYTDDTPVQSAKLSPTIKS